MSSVPNWRRRECSDDRYLQSFEWMDTVRPRLDSSIVDRQESARSGHFLEDILMSKLQEILDRVTAGVRPLEPILEIKWYTHSMRVFFCSMVAASLLTFTQPVAAQSRYENPVDKKIYETSGQFKTYQPSVPRDTRGQRVTTQNIMLLTGEPDLKVRVKVKDLAEYIKTAEACGYAELEKNKTAMSALVQFNCQPEKCEVKIASQGQAEETTLQALYDTLSKLPALRVTGEVAFQVMFNVGR
jgi:hypothetical protein